MNIKELKAAKIAAENQAATCLQKIIDELENTTGILIDDLTIRTTRIDHLVSRSNTLVSGVEISIKI